MQIDSSSDVATVDLTLPTSDAQTNSSNDDKMSCTVKTKIGRHCLEQYYEDFKEYIAGDLKEDSLSSYHVSKYGPAHLRQVELTKMVFKDYIIGLDLPLSIIEKPAFIQAMMTVDPKFRVPSRRSITSDYLPKLTSLSTD